MRKREWFGEWFDSPYYHILYNHRDEGEAKVFMDNLLAKLMVRPDSSILDIGCGRGRHAIYLNEKGFDVTGIDLSASNIEIANKSRNPKLQFEQHDMRRPYRQEAFHLVVNLFTSFGFFDTREEHRETIAMMARNLKPNGTLVMDFLNPYAVINQLVPEEIKEIEGIEFHINRRFDGEFILKEIAFTDQGQHYQYCEKVKAIRRTEFLEYFEHAGLRILEVLGNYELQPYEKESSDRLIMIAQK